MTVRNYYSLLTLIISVGLFSGCNKHPNISTLDQDNDPTSKLALAKDAYANYYIAMNLHHWDEARKYVVPGSVADEGVDLLKRYGTKAPANDPGSVDNLTGKLDGDVAYVWWHGNDFPVFKMNKQNDKWLFEKPMIQMPGFISKRSSS